MESVGGSSPRRGTDGVYAIGVLRRDCKGAAAIAQDRLGIYGSWGGRERIGRRMAVAGEQVAE